MLLLFVTLRTTEKILLSFQRLRRNEYRDFTSGAGVTLGIKSVYSAGLTEGNSGSKLLRVPECIIKAETERHSLLTLDCFGSKLLKTEEICTYRVSCILSIGTQQSSLHQLKHNSPLRASLKKAGNIVSLL